MSLLDSLNICLYFDLSDLNPFQLDSSLYFHHFFSPFLILLFWSLTSSFNKGFIVLTSIVLLWIGVSSSMASWRFLLSTSAISSSDSSSNLSSFQCWVKAVGSIDFSFLHLISFFCTLHILMKVGIPWYSNLTSRYLGCI